MALDKKTSAGYLANHMARLFFTGLARRIAAMGLAPGQFMVLLELWAKDGLTQKELVTGLDVEQATIANTLVRMERDGLVSRRAHPVDGRSQSIHLTRKGKALEKPATAAAQAQNAVALANLSEAERRQFITAMQKVITAMQTGED